MGALSGRQRGVLLAPASRAISGRKYVGAHQSAGPGSSRPRGLGSRLSGAAPGTGSARHTVSVKGVGTGGRALGRVALHTRPGSPCPAPGADPLGGDLAGPASCFCWSQPRW